MNSHTASTRIAGLVISSTLALVVATAVAQAGAQAGATDVAGKERPQHGAGAPPLIPLPSSDDFAATVDNPYLPFLPGTRWVYRGGTPDEPERIVVTVLDQTKLIEGISATVVRDTVRVSGEVVEDTLDWYAQDRRGRVWYLGEDSRTYENGQVVSREGSWEAGVDGAKAGIVMFDKPRVGEPYRQEYYAGHAEDQATFLTLDTRAATKAGVFKHLRMTEDTTPLDPAIAELKFYARGIGVVLEFDLAPDSGRSELVAFQPPR